MSEKRRVLVRTAAPNEAATTTTPTSRGLAAGSRASPSVAATGFTGRARVIAQAQAAHCSPSSGTSTPTPVLSTPQAATTGAAASSHAAVHAISSGARVVGHSPSLYAGQRSNTTTPSNGAATAEAAATGGGTGHLRARVLGNSSSIAGGGRGAQHGSSAPSSLPIVATGSLDSPVAAASLYRTPPSAAAHVQPQSPFSNTPSSNAAARVSVDRRVRAASTTPSAVDSPTINARLPRSSAGPSSSSTSSSRRPVSPQRRPFPSAGLDESSPSAPLSLAHLTRPGLTRSTRGSRADPLKQSILARPTSINVGLASTLLPSASIASSASSTSIFGKSSASSPATSSLSSSTRPASTPPQRPSSPARRPTSPVRPSSPCRRPLSPVRVVPQNATCTASTSASALAPAPAPAATGSPRRRLNILASSVARVPIETLNAVSTAVKRPASVDHSSTTPSASASTSSSTASSARFSPEPFVDASRTVARPNFDNVAHSRSRTRSQSLASSVSSVSLGHTSGSESLNGRTPRRGTLASVASIASHGSVASPFPGSYPASPPKREFASEIEAFQKVQEDAKVNRKILDLEITNASLLAINASLEKAKARQTQEIRDLRRATRDKTLAPLPSSLASGLLSPRSENGSSWTGRSSITAFEDEEELDLTWEEILARDDAFADVVRQIDAMNQSAQEALDNRTSAELRQIGARVINQYALSVPTPSSGTSLAVSPAESDVDTTMDEDRETSVVDFADCSHFTESADHSRATSIGID